MKSFAFYFFPGPGRRSACLRLLPELFSAFPVGKSPPSQLGPVTNLSLHLRVTTEDNWEDRRWEKDCSAMVRVRKVAGLEHLALVAYRELVVDMAGKIEEAVRGKQMGLGMEQEVGV